MHPGTFGASLFLSVSAARILVRVETDIPSRRRLLLYDLDAGNGAGKQCRANQFWINTEVPENTSVLLSGKFLVSSPPGGYPDLFFSYSRTVSPSLPGPAHLRLGGLCAISLAENCLNLGRRQQQPNWRLWVCTAAVLPTSFSPSYPAAPS